MVRPVIRRRRSRIMCRPMVVGMTRPSRRDRFPRWKRRWWACSHSWHEVALGSKPESPWVAEGRGGSTVKRRGEDSSGVEDILQQFTLKKRARRRMKRATKVWLHWISIHLQKHIRRNLIK